MQEHLAKCPKRLAPSSTFAELMDDESKQSHHKVEIMKMQNSEMRGQEQQKLVSTTIKLFSNKKKFTLEFCLEGHKMQCLVASQYTICDFCTQQGF